MTDTQSSNIFARSDTFFGVCEAIGRDFGFNPNWLRVAFAVPLLYSPTLAIAAYGVVGLLVLISRYAFPRPVQAMPAAQPDVTTAATGTPAEASEIATPAYAQAA